MVGNFENQALLIVQNRKETAEQKAEQNKFIAYSKTNFRNEFNILRTLQLELAKLEFNKKDTAKILNQIETQKQKLINELKKANLKPDDLKPNYTCKLCCDTGYINGKSCDCLEKEKHNLILKYNNINIKNLPNFSEFNFSLYSEEVLPYIQKVFNTTNKFVNDFKVINTQMIVLMGNTGTGKTFTSECMLHTALDNNIVTIFTTAFNLNNDFLKYHLASIENKAVILEPYLTCEFLIIDDLGTENKLKNVTNEYLYLLISERNKNNLKTVITTNLTKDMFLEIYESRIYSRVFNYRTTIEFEFPNKDLRIKS